MKYTKLGNSELNVSRICIEDAARAVDIELTTDEISYLEELYLPHQLAGVMAQNKPQNAKEKHVWTTGDQKINK